MKESLTKDERRRYARNIALPEIGEEGQLRLRESSVIVVGCGALGSVIAHYLAGAGVGRLGLVDYDTVDVTNLQRQVFYSTDQCGLPKAVCLARSIRSLNPHVLVEPIVHALSAADVEDTVSGYDVIVEATDNPGLKHLLPSVAFRIGKPCVCGGVSGWYGQVTVVFPGGDVDAFTSFFGGNPPCAGSFIGCGSGGVFGPVAGLVACTQAAEVIKIITSAGKILTSRLLLLDALHGTAQVLSV